MTISHDFLQAAILIAGIGQLTLAAASLAIPSVLGWQAEMQKVRRLTRQVFWTYAGYIWGTNVAFGLVSVLLVSDLIDGSRLSTGVTGFIALYWAVRCLIQWFWFDRSDAPQGWHVLVAEVALNILFVGLTATYSAACWLNVRGPTP